jgi:hypothetical protein
VSWDEPGGFLHTESAAPRFEIGGRDICWRFAAHVYHGKPRGEFAPAVVGLRGSSAAVCPDLSLPARGRTIVTGDSRDSVVWIPMLRPCPVRVMGSPTGLRGERPQGLQHWTSRRRMADEDWNLENQAFCSCRRQTQNDPMTYGYARGSMESQSVEAQVHQLRPAGARKVSRSGAARVAEPSAVARAVCQGHWHPQRARAAARREIPQQHGRSSHGVGARPRRVARAAALAKSFVRYPGL